MTFYLAEAERLAQKYQTRDPERIAREEGIDVIYLLLQAIHGMSFSLGLHKFIIVNSSLPEIVQKLVIAHELGHFILHPEGNFLFILHQTLFYSKHEHEADMFSFQLIFGEKLPPCPSLIREDIVDKMDKFMKLSLGG
jgi:Zn-dependent peptidase ImmA (M78 family)